MRFRLAGRPLPEDPVAVARTSVGLLVGLPLLEFGPLCLALLALLLQFVELLLLLGGEQGADVLLGLLVAGLEFVLQAFCSAAGSLAR